MRGNYCWFCYLRAYCSENLRMVSKLFVSGSALLDRAQQSRHRKTNQGPHAACGVLFLETPRASPCFVFAEGNAGVTDLLSPACASCSVPAACSVLEC